MGEMSADKTTALFYKAHLCAEGEYIYNRDDWHRSIIEASINMQDKTNNAWIITIESPGTKPDFALFGLLLCQVHFLNKLR